MGLILIERLNCRGSDVKLYSSGVYYTNAETTKSTKKIVITQPTGGGGVQVGDCSCSARGGRWWHQPPWV